jgi:hypothetical protein
MRFLGILLRSLALLATLSLAQAKAPAPLTGLWDSGHGEETLTPEQ